MIAKDFNSSLFFLKYFIFKKKSMSSFRDSIQNQFLSPDELENLNWKKTKLLIDYAYNKVPYYKRIFDKKGLKPNDLINPDDYCHVPILNRETLKNNFEDLVSIDAKPRDLRLVTTGGSTGEPVKVYHEKRVVRASMEWRMLSWWGVSPGVNFASVYRHISKSNISSVIDRAILWPTKKILLNATLMGKESINRFIKDYKSIKPVLLHGYVGAMDNLASYIIENNIKLPKPIAIWVTSSPLTKVQEKRIEKAFRAPVYDQYGCCEVYWLAAQCPEKKALHMFYDTRKFEFLNNFDIPVPTGELGNIIITDLENYLFPIIRYKNGDMGRRIHGKCDCGINLPLMDKVRGRITDIIHLPSGKQISGDFMTTIFDDSPDAVVQFRVHQSSDYSINILVVPNLEYKGYKKKLDDVQRNISQSVNTEVPVQIKITERISQKGGKLCFVQSDV